MRRYYKLTFYLAVILIITSSSLLYIKSTGDKNNAFIREVKNINPDYLNDTKKFKTQDNLNDTDYSKIQDDHEIQNDYGTHNDSVIQDDSKIQDDPMIQDNSEIQEDLKAMNDSKIQNDLGIQEELNAMNDSVIQDNSVIQDDYEIQEDLEIQNGNKTSIDVSESYNNSTIIEKPYINECLKRINEKIKNNQISEAVQGLSNYLLLEPLVEINEECKPPPLPEVKCEDYTTAFGGNPRPDNKKIGILIQFGFDVDMLEVYLNEVYDLVDKFFITESVVTHSIKQHRKPLIWDRLKYQKRFSKFTDKIVHFVIDASDLRNKNEMWVSERNQEVLRYEKFLKWNEENNNYFGEDDIIGFGDADEIPSRKAINILKHCTGDYVSIDVGSIFIYGTHNTVVRSDWPIRGHPYTYGDPSFFTVKSAKNYGINKTTGIFPNRMRGRSGKYLIGEMGAHITYYPYLPFLLNKYIVCTECKPFIVDPEKPVEEIFKDAVNYSKTGHRWSEYRNVEDTVKNDYYIPWFIKCNPDRFPEFFNKPEPRIYLLKSELNFEC